MLPGVWAIQTVWAADIADTKSQNRRLRSRRPMARADGPDDLGRALMPSQAWRAAFLTLTAGIGWLHG